VTDQGEPTTRDDRADVDEILQQAPEGGLRRLPRLLVGAFRLVNAAAPGPLRLVTALQIGNGLLVAGQLIAVRLLLQRLLAGSPSFGVLIGPLVLLTAMYGLATFGNLAISERQRLLSELVSRHTMSMLLDAATSVDLIELDRPAFHDRLLRAQINAQVRPVQMVNGALGFVSTTFSAGGVALALLFVQPVFLAVILLAFGPAWIATRRASRSSYRFTAAQARRDRRRAYLSGLLFGKQDAKEVRAYELATPLRSRHDSLYDERIDDVRTMVRERTLLGLVGSATTAVLGGVTIAALAWYATSGHTDLASAAAATGALLLLIQRLQALQTNLGTLYESSLFIKDFTGFIADLSAVRATRPTVVAPADPQRIRVEGISFRYPSSPDEVLTGVSLELRRGEVVALVGENGSGKTTLAKILAGLYQPCGGKVTWDGTDLAGCDDRSVRDRVAILFQDFSRFQLTLDDNIQLGRWRDAGDDSRRDEAVRRAGLEDVMAALPDGYRTHLGPEFLGGIDLSGGQWQRLALARAFFRQAPIVILDEPTASLDPRAESELYARMRDLYAGSAVLLISHRFASVRSADRIYVLDAGRVVEQGRHPDLMVAGGLYAELFTRQAAGYVT
jgi:ATP-binding cassette subfamily B protein